MGMNKTKKDVDRFGKWLMVHIDEMITSGKVNKDGPTIVTVNDPSGCHLVTVCIQPGEDGIYDVSFS